MASPETLPKTEIRGIPLLRYVEAPRIWLADTHCHADVFLKIQLDETLLALGLGRNMENSQCVSIVLHHILKELAAEVVSLNAMGFLQLIDHSNDSSFRQVFLSGNMLQINYSAVGNHQIQCCNIYSFFQWPFKSLYWVLDLSVFSSFFGFSSWITGYSGSGFVRRDLLCILWML